MCNVCNISFSTFIKMSICTDFSIIAVFQCLLQAILYGAEWLSSEIASKRNVHFTLFFTLVLCSAILLISMDNFAK